MKRGILEKKFKKIGAAVAFDGLSSREKERISASGLPAVIDIQRIKRSELFRVGVDSPGKVEAMVLDCRPKEKHLLLMLRGEDGLPYKYLCGHDERHWYVAAVPSGKDVRSAMEALKPDVVRESQVRAGVKYKESNRRRNKGFIRQGEWFFVPRPDLNPDPKLVLKKEPISRGGGSTAHIVEFLYREGGEAVYVSRQFPNGLTFKEKKAFERRSPQRAKGISWQRRTRDAKVFARGKVRHRDHKTINLPFWHEVRMNTEAQANGAKNMVFLD